MLSLLLLRKTPQLPTKRVGWVEKTKQVFEWCPAFDKPLFVLLLSTMSRKVSPLFGPPSF